MNEIIKSHDDKVKLEKWYDGRKLRRYIQLLELSEQVVRSASTNELAKKVAKGFADHYRRMVMMIVMRPFNPEEIETENEQEKIFTSEVARLNSLFDPEFKV